MTWQKHKLPVPSGFTDFTWKKNRFLARPTIIFGQYILYDLHSKNSWAIVERINNDKKLEQVLNNLYERNGFLRRECSKQTFLANKYKKEADFWLESTSKREKAMLAEKNETNYWYNEYTMLKIKMEKLLKERKDIEWDDFDANVN